MSTVPKPLADALKRHRNPWNWSLQVLGLAALCSALWAGSSIFFSTGIIFLGTSLFDLHLPDMEFKPIWRAIRAEQRWLDAPWEGRKRVQAALMTLCGAGLFLSLAINDVLLLLLLIGFLTLGVVGYCQAASQRDQ